MTAITPTSASSLAPAQQRALDQLLAHLDDGRSALLFARPGTGRTTLLHALHRARGGRLLTTADAMDAIARRHPLAVEDALHDLLRDALAGGDLVIVDDFELVANVLCCGHAYPRHGLVEAAFAAVLLHAERSGARLVVGTGQLAMHGIWRRLRRATIEPYTADDYAHLCRAFLGEARAAHLDFGRVHRYARKLDAARLRRACETLPPGGDGDAAAATDHFIDHLRASQLASNVDLREVEAVALEDLKGVDDVVRALEANVVVPLERADLAEAYGLRAKRGVLLVGPPGTGKTTVGRALAHRLRGKFFLLDGSMIAGGPHFFERVQQLFEAAKQQAPAVVFIDDSDVLFEGNAETGFYRYLLTLLDGIESESAGRICLVLTAMDVASIPPALVRSGRIELWLEMRLPDEAARAAILADRCASLPPAMGPIDVPQLAAATDGLTGADLKRLVDDGKLLFAYDVARGQPPRVALDYLLAAADVVRGDKARYAEAEARARARRPTRPPYFDVMNRVVIGPFAEAGDGPVPRLDFEEPG
ncbi:MAG TPA: AAA family ATPase [Gemmatimonadaceae bacterium]|nr:AAA family ATPase [Gemmatimonadaceae bacterium]